MDKNTWGATALPASRRRIPAARRRRRRCARGRPRRAGPKRAVDGARRSERHAAGPTGSGSPRAACSGASGPGTGSIRLNPAGRACLDGVPGRRAATGRAGRRAARHPDTVSVVDRSVPAFAATPRDEAGSRRGRSAADAARRSHDPGAGHSRRPGEHAGADPVGACAHVITAHARGRERATVESSQRQGQGQGRCRERRSREEAAQAAEGARASEVTQAAEADPSRRSRRSRARLHRRPRRHRPTTAPRRLLEAIRATRTATRTTGKTMRRTSRRLTQVMGRTRGTTTTVTTAARTAESTADETADALAARAGRHPAGEADRLCPARGVAPLPGGVVDRGRLCEGSGARQPGRAPELRREVGGTRGDGDPGRHPRPGDCPGREPGAAARCTAPRPQGARAAPSAGRGGPPVRRPARMGRTARPRHTGGECRGHIGRSQAGDRLGLGSGRKDACSTASGAPRSRSTAADWPSSATASSLPGRRR